MKYNIRPVLSDPDELVTRGRFNYGTYKKPFKIINPSDSKTGFFKKIRLKEWQHFALVNDDFYITLVIFDAKKMAFAQVTIYDRGKNVFYSDERKIAPWSVSVPDTLFFSRAGCRKKGFRLDIFNELNLGQHRLKFAIHKSERYPSIKGSFTLYEDLSEAEPVVVCLPLKKNDAMYSHKFISSLEGSLYLNDQEYAFQKNTSYGLIDIHKGYYPYVMKWNWGTGGGFIGNDLIGFNLTDNQVTDQDRFNENCIWVNGKLFLLPPVKFNFDKYNLMKPWMIKDRWGLVDLVFIPEGIRRVEMNILIVKNRYRAPYGTFYGKIKTTEGTEYVIRNFFGMCEDMYLRS